MAITSGRQPTGRQPTGRQPDSRQPTSAAAAEEEETTATPGTPITNANATTSVPVNYCIDDHSGFKLFREKGYTDGYGRFTVMGDARHPQDSPRTGEGNPQVGPQSPEQNDSFISTAVLASDL